MIPNTINVSLDDVMLAVELADGRVVSAPIAWYPRLAHGSRAERDDWRLIAGGQGIHWSALDEDVSVENLLNGQLSGESQASLKKWLAQRSANVSSER
jgi:fructose-1-phosphate kinase PfkB-like protein